MNKYVIDNHLGIANVGNLYRIKQVMRKALRGESITIGFLGGSITQGCLSSTPQTCYAYLVYKWWKEKFPQAEVKYVNAGIGGTTSQFGVARVDNDLLSHGIDFTTVEFSVNDDNTDHVMETYEGLVRHIYGSENNPAMLIVNNIRYDNGKNAQEKHNAIGTAYRIPCVSMKMPIYSQVQNGIISPSDITEDYLHPNDEGHSMVAEVITYFLELVYDKLEDDVEEYDTQMPEPVTLNAYEHSVRYQNTNSNPVNSGFQIDDTPQNDIREIFRHGWFSFEKGAKLTFEIEASCIAVQYRKSIIKPTPVARVIVDGNIDNAMILNGNFEETWGDSLHIDTVVEHLPYGKHSVEIEIIETQEDDKVPFYLVSVIGSC